MIAGIKKRSLSSKTLGLYSLNLLYSKEPLKSKGFLYFFGSFLRFGYIYLFIYLFGVLHRFQHCTGHIMTGSWKGRGNQYIQFVRVLYCKLLTNGKQLPAFPLEAVPGTKPQPQRWEVRCFSYRKLVNCYDICTFFVHSISFISP